MVIFLIRTFALLPHVPGRRTGRMGLLIKKRIHM